MHLKCLRDAIAATNATGTAPRWFTPALELFTTALGSLGSGFDILYANLRGLQWAPLPQYWRTTLRLWADLNTSYGTTKWKRNITTMPLWYNIYFTFGKAKTPLAEVSKKTIGTLKALGFNRLQDFVYYHGAYVTVDLLLSLLPMEIFDRPASRTRLISDTMARFNLILPSDDPLPGPTRSVLVEAACHEWSL
ncbi:hypothetical protein PR002_g32291, partial [Phytophthora rubi]